MRSRIARPPRPSAGWRRTPRVITRATTRCWAMMNLLAFALHTFLELTDADYQLIRTTVGARRTFFEHLRALTTYLHFESWTCLMNFMMQGLEIGPHAIAKS